MRSQVSILAFAVLGMTACGDSTAPTGLDSPSALHSLSLGIRNERSGAYGPALIGYLLIEESLGGIAPFVNKFPVMIDGAWRPMYALALHESFPPGTCAETIFGWVQSPPNPCTPPALGVAVLLWQSRSAEAPPDRLVVLLSDVGTSELRDNSEWIPDTGVALYATADYETWYSTAGTLTSSVTATTTPCGIPLPSYAKSGNCSIAAFNVEGSITFRPVLSTGYLAGWTQTLTIPRQTLNGLWMAISEVQPIGPRTTRLVPRDLIRPLRAR